LGNLATPKSVQKLQTALHAKAKAEAGYRFYALYDKISRDDILAHAYAQCRSNKGAPGIDGQDFADIEAYGVERWLAELALALRQETYRPEPIRRVFIPKANGKLRPLGISSVRDRVCMTAALLVLEPIFEADLPPEIYAYRAGRNAQQAVVDVEELLFRGLSLSETLYAWTPRNTIFADGLRASAAARVAAQTGSDRWLSRGMPKSVDLCHASVARRWSHASLVKL
jgi:RNA-directed DNA polymerase